MKTAPDNDATAVRDLDPLGRGRDGTVRQDHRRRRHVTVMCASVRPDGGFCRRVATVAVVAGDVVELLCSEDGIRKVIALKSARMRELSRPGSGVWLSTRTVLRTS